MAQSLHYFLPKYQPDCGTLLYRMPDNKCGNKKILHSYSRHVLDASIAIPLSKL